MDTGALLLLVHADVAVPTHLRAEHVESGVSGFDDRLDAPVERGDFDNRLVVGIGEHPPSDRRVAGVSAVADVRRTFDPETTPERIHVWNRGRGSGDHES